MVVIAFPIERKNLHMLKTPTPFVRAFEQFVCGEYADELNDVERVFYSAKRLERDCGLRSRRDIPPFLGAGGFDNR